MCFIMIILVEMKKELNRITIKMNDSYIKPKTQFSFKLVLIHWHIGVKYRINIKVI